MRATVVARTRVGVDTPTGQTSVQRVRPYRAQVVVRPETFSERLRRLRRAQGLSLRGLGERSGVGWAAIGMIEQGHSLWPTAHTVAALARALSVSMGALWLGEAAS